MKYFILIFTSILLISSCNNDKFVDYNITCNISDKSVKVDSATVYVYEDDYKMNRIIFNKPVQNNRFTIAGVISKPMIAFVKLNNDSTLHYFIIENGVSKIDIGKKTIFIDGGLNNKKYLSFLSSYSKINEEKRELQEAYSKLINDSLLTSAIEDSLLKKHNRLTDSLSYLYNQNNDTSIAYNLIHLRFRKTTNDSIKQ